MGRFHRHDGDDAHHHHHHDHDHDHHHGQDHVHLADPNDTSHGDHSGYETGVERVTILEDIFSENDHRAEHNRELLAEHGVGAINLMSSPGSGKTALLEGYGAQISLLNTGNGFGGECHLDAPMVSRALEGLDLSTLDLVMIENVGNLVCPAEFEVGETRKAMVYSITEGEDKPVKYPVMFRSVQVVVINKMDLAPYLDFDMELFRANLEKVNPGVKVIEVSAKTGEGIDEWLRWVNPALVD